jgi:hypothetical protein
MNSVHLDCSDLHNIRLISELPNSIYIDGEQFIRQFEQVVQDLKAEKPLRKIMYREGYNETTFTEWRCGYFHRWGDRVYENREGQTFVTDTVAIVEGLTGTIYQIIPSNLQFEDWKIEPNKGAQKNA